MSPHARATAKSKPATRGGQRRREKSEGGREEQGVEMSISLVVAEMRGRRGELTRASCWCGGEHGGSGGGGRNQGRERRRERTDGESERGRGCTGLGFEYESGPRVDFCKAKGPFCKIARGRVSTQESLRRLRSAVVRAKPGSF